MDCNLELSIVLPTYNERENIKILIPQIEEAFKNINHEIIVVDDDSPDNTADCALELNKKYNNIRILSRIKKEGIGMALREGLNYAKGKIIISSDADLSFSVQDMIKLFNCINQGYDFVIGCRHNIQGSYYEMKKLSTLIKGIISKLGNLVLRVLTGINIHDFSANFRAIRREAWKKIHVEEKTNIVLFEMIVKARHRGIKLIEIPVSFVDRIHGKSKLNIFIEIPKYISKLMYYFIRYRFPKKIVLQQ